MGEESRKIFKNKKTTIAAIAAFILIMLASLIVLLEVGKRIGREPVVGERITKAEAYRLFSYIFYDKSEREQLDYAMKDAKGINGDEWFAVYLNALVSAEVINISSERLEPLDNINCDELRELLVGTARQAGLNYADIVNGLPERLKNARSDSEVLLKEFLDIYTGIIKLLGTDLTIKEPVKQEDEDNKVLPPEEEEIPFGGKIERRRVFVLGVVESKRWDKEPYILTEDEDYSYYVTKFQDYSSLYLKETEPKEFKLGEDEFRAYPKIEDYIDQYLEVFCCGDEIIYISAISDRELLLSNVFVMNTGNTNTAAEISAFTSGINRSFSAVSRLSREIKESVCDLTFKNGRVTSVLVKSDKINGKVLLTSNKEIEIEGLGKLALDEHYKIYKIYDELEQEHTSSILVGYTNTDFIIYDGKICAALIKEKIKARDIRVLISVAANSNYYHEQVELTADRDFTVSGLSGSASYKAGEKIKLTADSELLKGGRVKIETASENGKIKLLSIKRAYGEPAYRGSIEVSVNEKGLLIVNELSIEEYLYAVVTSEMPVSYGADALKVQAVCARSFAYKQLINNAYRAYGAHVDDTVNCQVYNNVKETDTSIFAVKDTYGKILEYKDKVITAYYFSTSCGFTTSVEDVWPEYSKTEHYTGSLQVEEELGRLLGTVDLSDNELFEEFILKNTIRGTEVTTFETDFSWYRWNVSISKAKLNERVNKLIGSRYKANSAFVLTLIKSDNVIVTPSGYTLRGDFKSRDISSIGEIQYMEILIRGESGIAKELLIVGSEATVKLLYQTNIRTIFAPTEETVYLKNNVTVDNFSLLPSACFIIKEGETEYTFIGGGYGHGVGMSQNGVKGMIDAGYSYADILEHYYNGVVLGFMYE